ncbi:hypothetical protein MHI37_09455 [Paenibacillus sp. FSL H8-0548]|uniref:hypothetical protein n=1 Tax=Paenibacillus sp. FSL H8-0548 TaxID=1920422 RepID=UPI00117C816D|nr:hypothetical protein [Paenibacillus sp. FSL H8-0548]
MRMLGAGLPRKHFREIYFLIFLAMIVQLTLFASIAYRNEQKALTDNEYESNKKFLSQITFNINYMDRMIANSALSMYSDQNIRSVSHLCDHCSACSSM